jgi:hypothetical protein
MYDPSRSLELTLYPQKTGESVDGRCKVEGIDKLIAADFDKLGWRLFTNAFIPVPCATAPTSERDVRLQFGWYSYGQCLGR